MTMHQICNQQMDIFGIFFKPHVQPTQWTLSVCLFANGILFFREYVLIFCVIVSFQSPTNAHNTSAMIEPLGIKTERDKLTPSLGGATNSGGHDRQDVRHDRRDDESRPHSKDGSSVTPKPP